MNILMESLAYNSISILAAFVIAYNAIPLLAPVVAAGSMKRRLVWVAILSFVLFANFSQDHHPDIILWVPIAALAGLVTSFFNFRVAKRPK
ncbi:hypothetical protein SFHH103_03932 [Sinorhizobium fredii HH103]|uniref:Transmembrane protein n=1 Tax=Sinorhizobium fredii (strain HH103) TaxID=1117943 RepID=G9A6B3_SINF1|nr:hypothetical protein [Sinorhizobium fredii]CCE98423.1 hypothetical protein SFHH103_03932 [Sinorhizobium fredii HH103]